MIQKQFEIVDIDRKRRTHLNEKLEGIVSAMH